MRICRHSSKLGIRRIEFFFFVLNTIRMNGNGHSSGIYPSFMSYYQPFTPQSVFAGLAFPGIVPLTYQANAAHPCNSAVPVPSFKEVKEELGSTLDHLGRKEKRKLIKNKRNRKKRQLLTKLEPVAVLPCPAFYQ